MKIRGVDRQRSYFNWGLRELQKRIEMSSMTKEDQYEIINLFIREMEENACKNRHTSIMFSCAADAGHYILDGFFATYM